MSFNPGGGGGSSSIAGSTDVALSSVQNDQVLAYDNTSSKWQNKVGGGAPTLANLPAGSTISVVYDSGWPARPTARTDIIVQWIDFTTTAPVPPGALTEHDIVLIPDGV